MNRPKTDTCTTGFSSLSMSRTLLAYDSWQEKIGGSWKASFGEGFLWLVGGSPGNECLAGSYSVDAADLLDGVECFDGLVGSESNHEVEASGDWSDGFYVADSFELADNVSEFSLGVCEDKAG